jgi:hypothetical protein
MEGLLIISHLVVYCVGIVTGIYAASQIQKDIDKRTKR